MKRKICLVLIAFIILPCLFLFAGCDKIIDFKVNFIVDNEVYAIISTSGNDVITMPDDPTKDNYIFDGWYWDNNTFKQPFTANSLLNQPLKKDMKVYAKWIDDINVSVYINEEVVDTLKTNSKKNYKIIEPKKPEDNTTNKNINEYFYGWFIDKNYQIPLTKNTIFEKNGAIYGKFIDTSNAYTYNINDGKVTITGYNGSNSNLIIVPRYINSFPVTSIAPNVFYNKTFIKKVIICAEIEKIEHNSFYGCNKLQEIELPKTLKTIDKSAFSNCSLLESINLPNNLNTIYENAFFNCKSLTKIDIPNNLTYIADNIFNGCSSLIYTSKDNLCYLGNINNPYLIVMDISNKNLTHYNIDINSKFVINSAFENCNQLIEISIPKNILIIGSNVFSNCIKLEKINFDSNSKLTTINKEAFSNCKLLKEISIPKFVNSIGSDILNGCSSLTKMSIAFSGDMKSIGHFFGRKAYTNSYSIGIGELTTTGESILQNRYYIPNSLKFVKVNMGPIPFFAFRSCNSIEEIEISNGISYLGSQAFKDCSSLVKITLPDSIKDIPPQCFDGCVALKDMVIPEAVTEIGTQAFRNCSSLSSINIPNNVVTIWPYSFSGCIYLKNIVIPDKVTKIDWGTFRDCQSLKTVTFKENSKLSILDTYAFYNCSSLVSIIIPNNVTSIGDYVFSQCRNLERITIPNSVTSIGNYVFSDCTSLTDIVIPNSVKTIGECAFNYCNFLKNVIFEKNSELTSLGKKVFYGCAFLTTIIIPNSVISIGDYAFKNCRVIIIYCEKENPSNSKYNWTPEDRPVYWYSDTNPTTSGNFWHYVDGVVTKW